MKTIYYKFFILLAALTTGTSCEDYLDRFPLDSPSNQTFYSSEDEIIMAVNACYNNITSFYNNNDGVAWVTNLPDLFLRDHFTDIEATRSNPYVFMPFKNGTIVQGTTFALEEWKWYYTGISRVNSLLAGMTKAQGVTPAAIYERVKSEARVIRAICYMNLINDFGDVPFITEKISLEEAATITRTQKSQILNFIYTELDEAAVALPNSYSGTNRGRITKGAAYAMKARVALYNKDYAVAKQAAKAVMDLNVYKMFPSYRNLFTYAGEYCSEIILDYQYIQTIKTYGYYGFTAPRNHNGQAQHFPTEDLVASFECTDGLPIDESPLYDPTDPFTNRDPRLFGAMFVPRVWDGTTVKTFGTEYNGVEFMSSKEVLYAEDGITVLPESLSEKEKTVLDKKTGNPIGNQEVTNAWASFTGYCLLKYVEVANLNQASYCNLILCRYPEILMIYAEASIELNDIDQSVLDAMNTIRARAYGNTNEAGVTDINATNYPKITVTGQRELRKILRRERKIELCFEGFRYDDLRRWGILTKALDKRKNYGRPNNFSKLAATDIPQIDDDGLVTFPYANETYGLNNEVTKLRYYEQLGGIPEAYNLFPIPLSEIQQNPNLRQNPGYN